MAFQAGLARCCHVKGNGERCGSPALRGQQYCFHHDRVFKAPVPENGDDLAWRFFCFDTATDIQNGLVQTARAIAAGTISEKRGALLLRALHMAMKNQEKVFWELFHPQEKVTEIPLPPQQEEAQEETSPEIEIQASAEVTDDKFCFTDRCARGDIFGQQVARVANGTRRSFAASGLGAARLGNRMPRAVGR
jgi:hypothetical protein